MKRVNSGLELVGALKNIVGLMEKDFADMLRELTYRALAEVQDRTPVDTGFLINNWHVVVDKQPSESTVSSAEMKINVVALPTNLKGVKLIVLYNNAEYAVSIEYGTAHSNAQPMVEPTHQIIQELAATMTAKLSKRNYNV